jgi:hypothetical protein
MSDGREPKNNQLTRLSNRLQTGLGRYAKDVPLSKYNMLSEVKNIWSITMLQVTRSGMMPDEWKLIKSDHLLFELASESPARYMEVVSLSKRTVLLASPGKRITWSIMTRFQENATSRMPDE